MFIWASGNTYKGEYKEDERDGYGEMKWTDGSIYQGEWSRGIQHGYGKMIFPNGIVKEGFFEFNVYKGPKEQTNIGSPGGVGAGVSFNQNDSMRINSHNKGSLSNFYGGPNPNVQRQTINDQSFTQNGTIQFPDILANGGNSTHSHSP